MSTHLSYALIMNLVFAGALISDHANPVSHAPFLGTELNLAPKGINSLSLGEWARHKELILSKRDSLSYAILDKSKCAHIRERSQDEISLLKSRLDKLEKVIARIGILENSDMEYVLRTTSKEEGCTSWDTKKHCIVFTVGSTANFIHELMHGWQFETGEIIFDARFEKGYLQDLDDEVDAYKAQFAYDPASVSNLCAATVVRKMEGITTQWVAGLVSGNGEKTYGEHGKVRVNINSPKAALMLAYPQLEQQFRTWQETWTMKEVPNVIYKKQPVADFD